MTTLTRKRPRVAFSWATFIAVPCRWRSLGGERRDRGVGFRPGHRPAGRLDVVDRVEGQHVVHVAERLEARGAERTLGRRRCGSPWGGRHGRILAPDDVL